MGRKKLQKPIKRSSPCKALVQKCYEHGLKLPPKELLDQFDFYYYGRQGVLGSGESLEQGSQLESTTSTLPTVVCQLHGIEMFKVSHTPKDKKSIKVWTCVSCNPEVFE